MKDDLESLLASGRPLLVPPELLLSLVKPLAVVKDQVEELRRTIDVHVIESYKARKETSKTDPKLQLLRPTSHAPVSRVASVDKVLEHFKI